MVYPDTSFKLALSPIFPCVAHKYPYKKTHVQALVLQQCQKAPIKLKGQYNKNLNK